MYVRKHMFSPPLFNSSAENSKTSNMQTTCNLFIRFLLRRTLPTRNKQFLCNIRLLLIDYTILYVKLITVHGLYDKLSTNIQRKLSQYEKNPAKMEKLSQYGIQPIRWEN